MKNRIAKELVCISNLIKSYGYVKSVELKPLRNKGNTAQGYVTFEKKNPFNAKGATVKVSSKGIVSVNGKRTKVKFPSQYLNQPGHIFDMAVQNWLAKEQTWDKELGEYLPKQATLAEVFTASHNSSMVKVIGNGHVIEIVSKTKVPVGAGLKALTYIHDDFLKGCNKVTDDAEKFEGVDYVVPANAPELRKGMWEATMFVGFEKDVDKKEVLKNAKKIKGMMK